ncbi:MAG: DUF87 domain-containing protein [Bacilli bacterium]|nr:DUF87 domain-containing protein [Bacilli bacterium]
MFGKIVGIENERIRVENLSKKAEISLIGIHAVFLNNNMKFVGIIDNISSEYIDIMLIGEIKNDKFFAGNIKKPSLNSSCRIITKPELELILGNQNFKNKNVLLVGNSEIYSDFKVTVDKNDFFSSHFAFLGNTGSGKSCGLARLLQNVFMEGCEADARNAHFVIFDAFNDYASAFDYLNQRQNLKFKNINCNVSSSLENETIKIPPYFLDVDDLAILLDVHTPDLMSIIANTLRIAYIFTSADENVINYQNSIIASSLQDILSSGKSSTQIRDQLIAVLTKFNTKDLNLESIISQPGYDRTLRQCLLIDNQGKINAMNLVVDFLNSFIQKDMDNVEIMPGFVYTLDDLYKALEFSLINEGILSSADQSYDKLNSLKVRLRSIINSDLKKVFEFDNVISKIDYVENFFKIGNNENAQIVSISFGDFDERTIKMLTKILSKIFFNYVTTLSNRGSFPIHIIIEEAHRYVQNDTDVEVIGYNIFERITKEGRKYGIFLGLITQRPTELSKTVLSQCGNFMVFKMYHPDDVNIVTSLSTHVTQDLKEKLKTLHPGMALCFGNSFNTPLITQFELPNPMPASTNVKVTDLWY